MKTSQRKAARAKRTRRYQGHGTREDLVAHNPIAQAMARSRIEADVRALRTRAGIHAHLGADAVALADACGRMVYVVCHAAGLHGLQETPEARILLGTANALADVVALPASLETHRPAILSGLDACERLLPHLHAWSLLDGALALDRILGERDFMISDVQMAVHTAPSQDTQPQERP